VTLRRSLKWRVAKERSDSCWERRRRRGREEIGRERGRERERGLVTPFAPLAPHSRLGGAAAAATKSESGHPPLVRLRVCSVSPKGTGTG